MNKSEFVLKIYDKLALTPCDEIDERLSFYLEIIDDRIEEGLSEEEAVSSVGTVDEIVAQIVADTPFIKIAKERIRQKRSMKAWEIVLLVLGSPIWISLLLSVVAVIFSLYITLWSVIVSLWAVFVSMVVSALGVIVAGIVMVFYSNVITGVAMISAGFVCAGLSIFIFYGCKAATKGTVILTKKITLWSKKCFIKKEEQ